jgi:hypothetical protein
MVRNASPASFAPRTRRSSRGEVEAEAAGFEADEQEPAVRVALEARRPRGAVAGAAVLVLVAHTAGIEPVTDDPTGSICVLVEFFQNHRSTRFGRDDPAGVQ